VGFSISIDGDGGGNGEQLEPGRYTATIEAVALEPLPFKRSVDGVRIRLAVGVFSDSRTVESWIEANDVRRLSIVAMAAGLLGAGGTINSDDLIGRRVGVEIVGKVAKSGRPYSIVSKWFPPEPPAVETPESPAPRRGRPPKPPAAAAGDDIPF